MNHIIDYKPKLIIPGGCSECQEDGTETQWPGSWNMTDKWCWYCNCSVPTPSCCPPGACRRSSRCSVCSTGRSWPPASAQTWWWTPLSPPSSSSSLSPVTSSWSVSSCWLQYEFSQSQHFLEYVAIFTASHQRMILITSFIFNHLSTSANKGIFTILCQTYIDTPGLVCHS